MFDKSKCETTTILLTYPLQSVEPFFLHDQNIFLNLYVMSRLTAVVVPSRNFVVLQELRAE